MSSFTSIDGTPMKVYLVFHLIPFFSNLVFVLVKCGPFTILKKSSWLLPVTKSRLFFLKYVVDLVTDQVRCQLLSSVSLALLLPSEFVVS